MLRFAILTLLRDGEMSGYDLVKAFDRGVTYLWPATQSQIYPTLRAMEENDGVIVSRAVLQEGRPDKRVFSISPAGVDELDRWVLQPGQLAATRDPFPLRAWNLPSLRPADAAAVIEHQRRELGDRLAALEQIAAHLDERSHGQTSGGRLAAEVGIRVLRGYLDWCDWAQATLGLTAEAGQ